MSSYFLQDDTADVLTEKASLAERRRRLGKWNPEKEEDKTRTADARLRAGEKTTTYGLFTGRTVQLTPKDDRTGTMKQWGRTGKRIRPTAFDKKHGNDDQYHNGRVYAAEDALPFFLQQGE